MLHHPGIDTLKLDRRFMRDVRDDANSRVVVESLIELGRRLGKRVVVEGVETAVDRSRTDRQAGCAAWPRSLTRCAFQPSGFDGETIAAEARGGTPQMHRRHHRPGRDHPYTPLPPTVR
ncbi:EAL domain-containing protein [Paraburkholderia sp. BR14427]|uniref:EAL domain-containing protein n=1 Tax=unclassified Paraburkholderia TaxID=2615204 RepID=UPI0034CFAE7D